MEFNQKFPTFAIGKRNNKTLFVMGYTHYFNFKNDCAPQDIDNACSKFKRAVELFKEGLKLQGNKLPYERIIYNEDWTVKERVQENANLVLTGGDGTGDPTITDTDVIFNGNPSCETFAICIDKPGWDFCKTNRRPYDFAVCLALLCFKEAFGDDFSFRSDGDIENGEEGWGRAKEIFRLLFDDKED